MYSNNGVNVIVYWIFYFCRHSYLSKNAYSRRYSTDCLSGIFDLYAVKNIVGINDLPEYATERGLDKENLTQNSHFQTEVHQYI